MARIDRFGCAAHTVALTCGDMLQNRHVDGAALFSEIFAEECATPQKPLAHATSAIRLHRRPIQVVRRARPLPLPANDDTLPVRHHES